MNSNLIYQTLHCHTLNSDGLLTHKEVLDQCLMNKIQVVAFTDHDVIPTEKEMNEVKGLNHPVNYIAGIEVSCDGIEEKPGVKIPTFHITGLFVDITNKELVEFSKNQLEDRIIRMKLLVKNLKSLGFDITEEDVLKQVKGKAIGQPHVVAALRSKQANIDLLNKFLEELKQKAKTDDLRKKQLEEIESREENVRWYVLVMSKDSMFSAYVPYQNNKPILVDDAVKLIRNAGGIAMVAHWSYNRDLFTQELVEEYLKSNRLDGMETVYAFGIEKNREQFVDDMLKLAELCDKYHKVQGGGGDFHKIEDFALMTNPSFQEFANRTKGLVERIQKMHPNLDLTWTSLTK